MDYSPSQQIYTTQGSFDRNSNESIRDKIEYMAQKQLGDTVSSEPEFIDMVMGIIQNEMETIMDRQSIIFEDLKRETDKKKKIKYQSNSAANIAVNGGGGAWGLYNEAASRSGARSFRRDCVRSKKQSGGQMEKILQD